MELPQMNTAECNSNTGKREIYESLSIINQSLQTAIEHLDKLKGTDALTPSFTELRCLALEQVRSEINLTATIRLHTSELGHANKVERQRLALEESLKELPALPEEPELAVVPSSAPESNGSCE